LIRKYTRGTFEDLFVGYQGLLQDPRHEGRPLQVHMLQSVGLLLRNWLAAPEPSDQAMFRNAVIDFDELFDMIARSHTMMSPAKREMLRHLFRSIKDARSHLNWCS